MSSTISGLSLTQTPSRSSVTSSSSVDTQRKLPPTLDQAKLPPLPPTRREREEKAKLEGQARATNTPKVPLITVKSAPNVSRSPALAPKTPPRPSGPPALPSRPREALPPTLPPRLPSRPADDAPSAQSPRRLPPPAASRSILSMGFDNKNTEPQNAAPIPIPSHTTSARPIIRELTDQDFDSVVKRGMPTFVKFYSPHCMNCQIMEPAWEQIGRDFAFASNRLTIAQTDVFTHATFHRRFGISKYPTILLFDGHNETPERYQDGGIPELDDMVRFLEEKTGVLRADSANIAVPSINISSKPSLAQIRAIQSRPTTTNPPASGCLLCRDFSQPDRIASQYPRQSLPPGDMTAYLADVLCGPFTSLTDKARAIFTLAHHNIAYDVAAFFGNNVKYVDPKDTITTGLAVCGGYAGLYAEIALKAGLECVMVTGHGKGYGYTPLKPGDRIPPCKPSGHAWNAVRIDGGEWKLLDACWGAGNVGNQVYNKAFKPSYFTMSNDEFGLKHFPENDAYFFRSDGRVQTWEQYMIGPIGAEPLRLYGTVEEHGLSQTSFSPPQKHIPVNSGETVRFQFSKVCEHWDHERNGSGKPYCMVLQINGVDGRKKDFVPFENNEFWWWVDVRAKDLGAPGEQISVYAVTTINGNDARGMTKREYLEKRGKCSTGFGGVCAWELV